MSGTCEPLYLPLVIIVILLLVIFALWTKIAALRRAAREIAEGFRDRLAADTNILIDISTRDAYMRKLAAEINTQLRLLRQERHRYQQGDRELKEAVTNISHDLRTPLTAISGYMDLLAREDKSETVKRYLAQIQNRVDASRNSTGLGLSIARLLVERMDGTIEASCSKNKLQIKISFVKRCFLK